MLLKQITCSLGLWLFDLQLAISVPTETDAATRQLLYVPSTSTFICFYKKKGTFKFHQSLTKDTKRCLVLSTTTSFSFYFSQFYHGKKPVYS